MKIIVDLIDKVGLLNVAFTGLVLTMNHRSGGALTKGIISLFNSIKAHKPTLSGFTKSLNNLPSTLKKAGTSAKTTGTELTIMGQGAKAGAVGVTTLTGSIKAFASSVLPILAVMALLGGAFKLVETVIDSGSDYQKKYAEKVEETTSKVESLNEEIETLTKNTDRTDVEDSKLKLLEKELELHKEILKIQQEDVYNSKFNGDVGFFDSIKATMKHGSYQDFDNSSEDMIKEAEYKDSLGQGTQALEYRTKAIEKATEENKKLQQEQLNLNATDEDSIEVFKEHSETIAENNELIVNAQNDNLEYIKILDDRITAGNNLTEAEQAQYDSAKLSLDTTLVQSEANNTYAESVSNMANVTEGISKTFEGMKSSMDLVSSAMSEMDSNGQLSIDTIMKMIESGQSFIDLMYVEDGVYKLKANSAEQMFELKKAQAIEELQIQKATLQGTIDGTKIQINAYNTQQEMVASTTRYTGRNLLEIASIVANSTKSMMLNLTGVTNSASDAANKAYDTAKNAVGKITDDKQLKSATANLEDMEAQLGSFDESISFLNNMTLPQWAGTADTVNEKLKDQEKQVGKTGEAVDKYSGAIKENEALQKSLEKQIKATNDAINAENDAFDDKEHAYDLYVKEIVKILEKEINALEKEKEAREEFYDNEIGAIEEKINLLDEETKKEDDLKKLEEARLDIIKKQQALEDIRKNKNVKVYQEGSGWTWQINKESEKEAMDSVEEAIKAFKELERQWNITQQKLELEKQVKALEDAKDENIKNIDAQIKKLEDLKDQWGKSMDIQEDINKYEGMVDSLKKFENGSYETRKEMLQSFTTTWQNETLKHNQAVESMTRVLDDLQRKADEAKEHADALREASDKAKESAQNAKGALDAYNNTSVQDKSYSTTITENKITYENIQEGNNLYCVKLENGKEISRRLIGRVSVASTNKENPSWQVNDKGNTITKWAKGGVTDKLGNGDELLDYTGMYKRGGGFVDGSKQKPEVVVSNDSATWLHDMLTSRIMPLSTQQVNNSNSSVGDTFTVENLTVKADSQSTVESILQQAYSLSKHNKK